MTGATRIWWDKGILWVLKALYSLQGLPGAPGYVWNINQKGQCYQSTREGGTAILAVQFLEDKPIKVPGKKVLLFFSMIMCLSQSRHRGF